MDLAASPTGLALKPPHNLSNAGAFIGGLILNVHDWRASGGISFQF